MIHPEIVVGAGDIGFWTSVATITTDVVQYLLRILVVE